MSIQYLSNDSGEITAVQVPIEEWEKIKNIYPDVDSIDFSLPEWHKKLIDSRLEDISKHPDKLKPITFLMNDLDE
ncbi:hypothetical protein [Pedobacter agri]|uniref:hypothetical protein n=1 Tax=Pedobacter agri TaxID=454586 RepID=UPI00292E5ED1|nr:hypothetical protein [Pedobacter agri]